MKLLIFPENTFRRFSIIIAPADSNLAAIPIVHINKAPIAYRIFQIKCLRNAPKPMAAPAVRLIGRDRQFFLRVLDLLTEFQMVFFQSSILYIWVISCILIYSVPFYNN